MKSNPAPEPLKQTGSFILIFLREYGMKEHVVLAEERKKEKEKEKSKRKEEKEKSCIYKEYVKNIATES